MKIFIVITTILFTLLTAVGCSTTGGSSNAPSYAAGEISRDAKRALQHLYNETPEAKVLAANAKGILVFPGILKAGFIAGAQVGDGALLKHGRATRFHTAIAVSYGLQAGIQKFG